MEKSREDAAQLKKFTFQIDFKKLFSLGLSRERLSKSDVICSDDRGPQLKPDTGCHSSNEH
jgi:hypothetical protein